MRTTKYLIAALLAANSIFAAGTSANPPTSDDAPLISRDGQYELPNNTFLKIWKHPDGTSIRGYTLGRHKPDGGDIVHGFMPIGPLEAPFSAYHDTVRQQVWIAAPTSLHRLALEWGVESSMVWYDPRNIPADVRNSIPAPLQKVFAEWLSSPPPIYLADKAPTELFPTSNQAQTIPGLDPANDAESLRTTTPPETTMSGAGNIPRRLHEIESSVLLREYEKTVTELTSKQRRRTLLDGGPSDEESQRGKQTADKEIKALSEWADALKRDISRLSGEATPDPSADPGRGAALRN